MLQNAGGCSRSAKSFKAVDIDTATEVIVSLLFQFKKWQGKKVVSRNDQKDNEVAKIL